MWPVSLHYVVCTAEQNDSYGNARSWNINSQPAQDTATNTEWQLPEVVLIEFVSPDDEHNVLETYREL